MSYDDFGLTSVMIMRIWLTLERMVLPRQIRSVVLDSVV